MLTPRQELILRKVVERTPRPGQPVGSKALAADPELDCGPVDDPQRAGAARGARAARPPAHVARAACRPTPGTATTSTAAAEPACRPAPALELSLVRREVDEAMRVDDRDAVAGHEPAGDRLRAADRHRHDPPRRGARAAAAGADGRGHHLDRRRHQAHVHVRRARRPRPDRVGRRVPQRAPRRARPRARACCTRGCADPSLARERARVPRAARAGVHRARRDGRGHALRRRRRAPARRAPLPGPLARSTS